MGKARNNLPRKTNFVDRVKNELKTEEASHQTIRINAYSLVTEQVIKDILFQLKMDKEKFDKLFDIAKKYISAFQKKHEETNIMTNYKKPGKETQTYDETKKLLTNWRNQNISKYKGFFGDMFEFTAKISKKIARKAFKDPNKAKILEQILLSKCHSSLCNTNVNFNNKYHPKDTRLIPYNAVKQKNSISQILQFYINKGDHKCLSKDLNGYAQYHQKIAIDNINILTKQLENSNDKINSSLETETESEDEDEDEDENENENESEDENESENEDEDEKVTKSENKNKNETEIKTKEEPMVKQQQQQQFPSCSSCFPVNNIKEQDHQNQFIIINNNNQNKAILNPQHFPTILAPSNILVNNLIVEEFGQKAQNMMQYSFNNLDQNSQISVQKTVNSLQKWINDSISGSLYVFPFR